MSKIKMSEEELNLLVVYIEKRTVMTAYNGNVISIFDNGWSPAPGDSKRKIFTDVAVEMSTARGKACGMRGIESFFYENRPLRVRHKRIRETINENLNKIKGKLGPSVETRAEMSPDNMNPNNMNPGNMNPGSMMSRSNMDPVNLNPGSMTSPSNMNPANLNPGSTMNPSNMINPSNMNPANMNPGNMNQANMNQANMNPGNMNQTNMNQANMNQGIEGSEAQDIGSVSWVDEFGNFIFW
ncbi:1f9f88b3-e99e-463e-8269-115234b544a1-CDS [Sclerotinia trifoliorum]|uniref:1f9f88b3-e99e-463e-8269-115234b544a1-CDS n=1 Tax=Sclerotinia trifoliorum TaxID=28548 RepID=A0A8H2VZ52_9HELO|nr:1f9f88b3-e99e-463e-8269-115234b544a1-CDS [Sclerotinia trifoliorum]